MKPALKYTFLCALFVIAIQFWALAVISCWLTCDDSKAVQDFTDSHRSLACVAALIWGADREFFGRYLVMLFLGVIFWWVIKQKTHESRA